MALRTRRMKWGVSARVGLLLLFGLLTAAAEASGQARFFRVKEIIGKTVENTQGMEIGVIDDIVFSTYGHVEYLILARGGVMGWGDKKVPIPWLSVVDDLGKGEDKLIVNIDRKRFADAPEFIGSPEKKNPDQLRFKQQINSYYEKEGQR